MGWVRIKKARAEGFTWDGIRVNQGDYLLIEDGHRKLPQFVRLGIFEMVGDDLPPDAIIKGKSVKEILAETQPKTIKPIPQVADKKAKSEGK